MTVPNLLQRSSRVVLFACTLALPGAAMTVPSTRATAHKPAHVTETHSRRRTTTHAAAQSRNVVVVVHGRRRVVVRKIRGEHFSADSFTTDAENTTAGDVVAGEDPLVRASLLEALGNFNGTALAIDPKNGRILAMVNQKLALGPGAEPCSTIKLTVALAALSEGIITKDDTQVNLGRGYKVDLTYALARSINPYFESLGRQLGFERVKHYANQFGLGELAGYNVRGEQLGVYPDQPLPESKGGVGKMCSFGESVEMTPMQLGAIVAAIANGGSLFYLQHPTSPEDVASYQPRLKRTLNIQQYIPNMLPGMAGAVDANYGTARSLRTNFQEFPVLGKTGTCSNAGTRYGWFAGYGDGPNGRIVTVFFLTGGRPTFGPKAAELTGIFYRALANKSYFEQHAIPAIGPAEATGAGAPDNFAPYTPPVVVVTPVPASVPLQAPPATFPSGLPATAPTSR